MALPSVTETGPWVSCVLWGGSPEAGGGTEERGERTLTGTPGVGQVHATQEQLNAMAQRCQDTGETLATGMAQLLDRIQSLSGGGMSGAANNALQGVSADLNSGLTTILNALDELSGKISNASSQYGVNDEDAANEIRAAAEATGNSTVINALRG
ncbi:WXG100 family type VII secretion target [Solwaraspora sp. WMMD792]|uniref:WXG100 family type VII secretion target n=1 Tax=Solwaraspora sp. WMMD792 TaxID=3016099 RepID=UPI00241674E5|nr:WXG100 family type VII secretion target [Solwaraspora sp. WMMD792]MDG4772626.1 WXG100 family type VII secretion target [Solwaraspora sp. WMMD792]